MKMYFTSMYGDISIEVSAENKDSTLLRTTELGEVEKNIVKEILKEYDIFPEKGLDNQIFTIEKRKIEDVHKVMKKLLKKDRPTLTAIKYKDGKIECIEELQPKHTESETGVTVDRPRRGCPMPEVLKTEIRASKVLKEFLSKIQLSDYNKHLQFVSIGGYSEKPYLVTSRWCENVTKYGQLYDIADHRVICANCWEIPPSEELLSLKLMIEHKEKEFI